jgi:hypothetical protein
MKPESQIDTALCALGSAAPPPGLERRLIARLEMQDRRSRQWFRIPSLRNLAAGALACGLAAAVIASSPRIMEMTRRAPQATSRAIPRTSSSFGAASAVHVPSAPVVVQPAPLNHGRGRARSQTLLAPGSSQGALPDGVAAPSAHFLLPARRP